MRTPVRGAALAVVLAALWTGSAPAWAQGAWVQLDLDGGSVVSIAIDPRAPTTLYAASSLGGVFRSVDAGATWAASSTGLTTPIVHAVVVHPTDAGVVYAATAEGLFRSVDHGATWTFFAIGGGLGATTALLIHPDTPATMYVLTSLGRVLRSTNGGTSWSSLLASPLSPSLPPMASLALDPQTPMTVYAGSIGRGVFRSVGTLAQLASTGMTDGNVRSLAVDPRNPSSVLAGTDTGLFRSADGGATWTATGSTLTDRRVDALEIDRQDSSSIYAAVSLRVEDGAIVTGGVFHSADGAETWQLVSAPFALGDARVVALDPVVSSTVYVGSLDGVYRSADRGVTWAPANSGLRAQNVTVLATDPGDPATVYAGSGGGLFQSRDAGATWSRVLAHPAISAVAVHPHESSTIYAGTTVSGVFRSTDHGTHWSAVNAGLTTHAVTAIAIDPLTPSTLYAATDGGGVFRSLDGGEHWTAVNVGLTHLRVVLLAISPQVPSMIYAGTQGGGLFRSVDGGEHWTPRGFTGGTITALALHPGDPSILYAATRDAGRLLRSSDGGGVWLLRLNGLQSTVVSIVVDPDTPTTVYASSSAGAYRTTDEGGTWLRIDDGLAEFGPFGSTVHLLAAAPGGHPPLYAGVQGSGVFGWEPNGFLRPVVSGIVPPLAARGTTQPGEIHGQHLAGATLVTVQVSHGVTVRILDGGSDTVLPVEWTVAPDAVLTTRSITVKTPGGPSVPFPGLTIVPPPLPPPALHTIAPVIALPGTIVPATIEGINLTQAIAVTSSDSRVTAVISGPATATALPVLITVAPDMPPGEVSFTVTTLTGTSPPLAPFTIQAPPAGGWGRIGPDGGTVLSLAVHPLAPSIVYAGTAGGGLFRSLDGGESWSSLHPALTLLDVRAVAIDPRNPSTLYAGGDSGFFKGIDNGETWHQLFGLSIQGIAVHPEDANVLYVAANAGVYVTRDGGVTWTSPTFAPTFLWFMHAVVLDPRTPSTLYGARHGIVLRIWDDGMTWDFFDNRGIPPVEVRALAVDPVDSAVLYAGTDAGLFRSSDGGDSWTSTTLTPAVSSVLVDAHTPGTVFAALPTGVARSRDHGETWTLVGTGPTFVQVRALAADPQNPGTVYAGASGGGVFRTVDAGDSWSPMNVGLTHAVVRALAIDRQNPSVMIAGTSTGLWRTADAGATWSLRPAGLVSPVDVRALAVNPGTPGIVYAGTAAQGVLRSSDAGASWTPVNAGLGNLSVFSLAVDPQTPTTVYAGTGQGAFRSLNRGASWTWVTSGVNLVNVRGLAVVPQTPSTVYAMGGAVLGPMLRSVDGGTTWTVLPGAPPGMVSGLVADPIAASTLYLIGGGRVFRSTDAGGTWQSANAGIRGTVAGLVADPDRPGVLYAATTLGVFRTEDSGTNWIPLRRDPGDVAPQPALSLALVPGLRDVLYAGADGLATWRWAPPPTLARMAPGRASIGMTRQQELTGTYFFPGATLVIEPGADVVAADLAVVSPSVLTAAFTASHDAVPGVREVVVRTPHGTSAGLPIQVLMPHPELSLALEQPPAVGIGFDVPYVVAVHNHGTASTTAPVVVSAVLPAGMGFVSATGGGWQCTVAGQQLTCVHHELLAVNDSSTLTWIMATDDITTAVAEGLVTVETAGDPTSSETVVAMVTPVVQFPALTLTIGPSPLAPGQPATADITLAAPFPHEVAGTLRLTFASTAVVPSDDPAIQFASGGREVAFTIEANTVQARFFEGPQPGPIAFQTGTVAGTLAFTGTLQAGRHIQMTFSPSAVAESLTIQSAPPTIHSLETRTDAGAFAAHILLSSTPREVTHMSLQFVTASPVQLGCGSTPGCSVAGSTMTLDVESLFHHWFTGQSAFGGLGTLRVPLAIHGNVQGSVVVRLRNRHGMSNEMSFTLP